MTALRNLSIRTTLGLVICGMGGLLIAVAIVSLADAVQRSQRAAAVATRAELSRYLFETVQDFRLARSVATRALAAVLPATDTVRGIVANEQTAAAGPYDAAIKGLLRMTVPGLSPLLARLQFSHDAMAAEQSQLESELAQPRSARDADFALVWVNQAADYFEALGATIDLLEGSLKLVDPAVDQLLTIKRAAWMLRNLAGDEAILAADAIKAGRPWTPFEIQTHARIRGAMMAAWALVREATARADSPPRLVTATANAGDEFFAARAVTQYDALANGHASDLSYEPWFLLVKVALDRLGDVANAALDEMVVQARRDASLTRQSELINGLLLVVALGLAAGGYILIWKRVSQPIESLTDVIGRLALQDFAVEIPALARGDELGRMQQALLVLRDNGRTQQEAVASANAALSQLANIDSLTGLANRRRLDELIAIEWRRGARELKPISVLMIDVDHFKKFNDHYGHLKGDACLRRVADLLASEVMRPADVAARFGGEEFVVLLPDIDVTGAEEVALRIQDRMHELAMEHLASPIGRVTLSIGIGGAIASAGATFEAVLAAADRGVYRAKSRGRDRICRGDDHVPVDAGAMLANAMLANAMLANAMTSSPTAAYP